ncbi:MAG: hypothetical protein H7Z17_07255 [Fuerstia sp.]|nr:hypothetical protein [Fuerstiella sp.]
MIRTIRLSVLLMAFSVTTALAEKNVSIDPKIASLTSPGTAQTFDAALAEPMAAVKGE